MGLTPENPQFDPNRPPQSPAKQPDVRAVPESRVIAEGSEGKHPARQEQLGTSPPEELSQFWRRLSETKLGEIGENELLAASVNLLGRYSVFLFKKPFRENTLRNLQTTTEVLELISSIVDTEQFPSSRRRDRGAT